MRIMKLPGNSLIILFLSVGFLSTMAHAEQDFTLLSLEDLMNIEVTSVAKKAQRLSESAAAVFIITQEDIRRSGVTNIPDALRMVPGLEVARIDANKWSVTSRGFNGRFANKLLVLIDGRSVYSPLFSGVFWDVQDTMLENIERIEVIRGPGASLWGANAVNGIINIITKKASETGGGLASAGAGTEERYFGAFRYGAQISNGTHVRIYGKYFNRDNFVDSEGNETSDRWHMYRGGFRLDKEWADDGLTLQGDIYGGKVGNMFVLPSLTAPYNQTVDERSDLSGGYILGRWAHTFSGKSDMSLQIYYDRTKRYDVLIKDTLDTFDLDFQHRFPLGTRHDIIWGLGYRYTMDDFTNGVAVSFDPDRTGKNLFSAFVQDEITLIENRLRLILGSKFEHNDYTGFEVQPSGRFLWTPDDCHVFWGAVSRAVRTPSRADRDADAKTAVIPPFSTSNPSPLPVIVEYRGNKDFKSEELTAYELGYRYYPAAPLSLDIAAFFNVYKKIRTADLIMPIPPDIPLQPYIIQPLIAGNNVNGETYGIEVSLDYRPFKWWRLQGAYTFFRSFIHLVNNSNDPGAETEERSNPRHQVSLLSSMQVRPDLDLDLWFRFVDSIHSMGIGIKSYATLDARIAWRPAKNVELSVTGQNLLEKHHPETFGEQFFTTSEVPRSVYGKVTWRF
jgi:iron complex outermembrane recepter protein